MNPKIEEFVSALNKAYTDRGVNGVAKSIQVGRTTYVIECIFDAHKEVYLVGESEGIWKFIRVFQAGEL